MLRTAHVWKWGRAAVIKQGAISLVIGFALIGGVVANAAIQAAAPTEQAGESLPPELRSNLVRLHETVTFGVPARYRAMHPSGVRNPAVSKRGEIVFRNNCAACHGMSGRGDGPVAGYQAAPPANLAWLSLAPTDKTYAYIYWVIAEGGGDYGSEMPAFKSSLSKPDIDAVISYVQSGPSPPVPADSRSGHEPPRRR